MLKIYIQDDNWNFKSGETFCNSQGYELILNAKLVHEFMQPILTEEVWGGVNFIAQTNHYQGYSVHFGLNDISSEILPLLINSKNIVVWDIDNGEKVTVDSNSISTIDTTGRQGTTAQGYKWIFMGEKIIKYPAMIHNLENSLQIPTLGVVYHTKFNPIYEIIENNRNSIDNESGRTLTTKIVLNTNIKMLFFFKETMANELVKNALTSNYSDIIINKNISILDKPKIEISELPEGLYKIFLTMLQKTETLYA